MSRTHTAGGSAGTGTIEVRRPGPTDIALVCGVMATAAVAGAVGLISGALDLGATVTARLPADSPQLAGAALAVVVALPMTAAAVAGARRLPPAADLAVLAGSALVGWIVVEAAVIRAFSWLQPACLLYGSVVAVIGLLARRLPTPAGGRR